MTGNKRITCSSGVWQTAPTCHVIEQADDVFPDWWLIVGAIVLCLLVLICFICVVCYFCCASGRVVDNTIYPVTNRFSDGCCGSRSGCCRSGCCGRENGCCTCLKGGCACAQGCCTSGTGCCLLGGSGTCCCCCGQSGKKGRGKKKGVKAGQGNTGKGKGTGRTLGDDGQAPSSVITTPPRSHATVVQSPAKTEKKTTKTPPPESTTSPGGHYVFIPASDGDVKNSSPAHHNPKVHSHSHTVYHTSQGSVGPAHGTPNHAHGHNSHAHGHNSHAHGHNSHAYIVHSPPVPASGNVTPCSCCGPIGPGNGRSGWILVQDAMHQDRLRHSEDLHLEVLETRSDGDVEQQKPVKTKKPPAKEVKGWLPHSHPVRTINTSTK